MLDSGDAIIGDVIMGGYMGGAVLASKPNYHYFAEDISLAMASLDRVLAASSGRLLAGHGGPLRHKDVVGWRSSHSAVPSLATAGGSAGSPAGRAAVPTGEGRSRQPRGVGP
jgi:hypothetical protein